MHLDGEILTGVDELDQEWERISELLIDAVPNEETFVLVNELWEVETKVHITDHTALDGYGLMPRDGTNFPGLADIWLRGIYALEGGYLVSAPNHGAEVGLELVGLHYGLKIKN